VTFHYWTVRNIHYKMSTQDGNSQPLFPSLCKNGCGFFSGIDSKGFCSVCYKKYLKKEEAEKTQAGESDDTTSAVLAQLSLEEAPAKVASEEVETTNTELEVEVAVPEVIKEVIAEEVSTTDGACAVSAEKEDEKGPKESKKKKNRCAVCKKKLGLTGFSCRCEGLFCAIHRYTDKHECNFDYKAMGEKEISEANPLIVAAKVAKI